ncbi:MAG: aminotransferase class I/II-fold pyridoxal phosphate-dependent enzyme [Hyphomonadaceae bacterium]
MASRSPPAGGLRHARQRIKEAAYRAIREGKTRYTDVDGIPELKDAIVAKFKRENGLDYKRSQINVSPGGKPVIFNAFMATLNIGDEVVIPTPYWNQLSGHGGDVRRDASVRANLHFSDGFKLKPEPSAKAITPHTKWVMLNSPSNPSGAAYTEDELRALAAVLLDFPDVLCSPTISTNTSSMAASSSLPSPSRAAPEGAHADHERRVEGLRHDRLAHRLCRRPEWLIKAMGNVMTRTSVEPVLGFAMGGGGSVERAAGLHR